MPSARYDLNMHRGRHDLKFGFENYQSTRTGGNSQSSTSYVFYTPYLTEGSSGLTFAVDRFILFESRLSRHGPHYQEVASFPLV